LINGATGAIGSAAVQLCRHFGAEVTAVCNTKNLELVKSLGANLVIDYTQEDFTKLNQSFDFIFDAVGESSFGKCKPLLKKDGIYISTELGKGGQNPFLAIITPLLGGKKLLFPFPTISKQDVVFLKELVGKGQFKPVIDRHYSLEQIVEATRYVETGQKIGNVVIKVSHL
jgi:NADPH:quinone reductase-like Zn-dependent oxidoreductase